MLGILGLLNLLGICFLSSTLIPFPSEATVYYAFTHYSNDVTIFIFAVFGNSLGGYTNYFLGKFARNRFLKKEYPKTEDFVNKYGFWTAFFSFLPFIGDPLMLLLGFYRAPILGSFILSMIGKATRYALIFWFLNY